MSKKYCFKFLRVGPGGMKCNCCAPAPGKRKEMFRSAKRQLDRALMRVEKQELEAIRKES